MKKILTNEEWIKRAIKKHGNKYDYSKVEYKGWNQKVCIICPIHGEFWQNPTSHIAKQQKRGCPKCGKSNAKTTEQFIREAKQIHGDKYDYSKVKYVNNITKVCIICPEHGEFLQIPYMHLRGNGCIKCNFAPIIAHVLAIFPVFCGISGSTITMLIFIFASFCPKVYHFLSQKAILEQNRTGTECPKRTKQNRH